MSIFLKYRTNKKVIKFFEWLYFSDVLTSSLYGDYKARIIWVHSPTSFIIKFCWGRNFDHAIYNTKIEFNKHMIISIIKSKFKGETDGTFWENFKDKYGCFDGKDFKCRKCPHRDKTCNRQG